MRNKLVMYLDQYGHAYCAHTVKELRAKVSGRISKMYIDKKDGSTAHIGYVIGQHWLTAFSPLELPA